MDPRHEALRALLRRAEEHVGYSYLYWRKAAVERDDPAVSGLRDEAARLVVDIKAALAD